jgi:hypothetical protein
MRPHPPFMVLAGSPLRRNVCIEPSKSCLRSTGAPVELFSFSEASDCDMADGYGIRAAVLTPRICCFAASEVPLRLGPLQRGLSI